MLATSVEVQGDQVAKHVFGAYTLPVTFDVNHFENKLVVIKITKFWLINKQFDQNTNYEL